MADSVLANMRHTRTPRTPEFIEMIDNMRRVEPLHCDTAYGFDLIEYLGASERWMFSLGRAFAYQRQALKETFEFRGIKIVADENVPRDEIRVITLDNIRIDTVYK